MKITSGKLLKTGLPTLAAAFLCSTTNAQISTNKDPVTGILIPYECAGSGTITLTHNRSLVSTIRTVTCQLPTSFAHYYDLASPLIEEGALAGQYHTLKCVDFSVWSSSNSGDQDIFVRVYQDLVPGDGLPDTTTQLLLGQEVVVLPPNSGGVAAGSDGRTDGDQSVLFNSQTFGGILLSPDISFWIEVGHDGEAVTRFAANDDVVLIGEAGDDDDDWRQSWVKAPGCSGGGGVSANWQKHKDWTPPNPRDFVMQIHLDQGDTRVPPVLPFGCPQDITGPGGVPDRIVNTADLLGLLTSWGQIAPPRPLGDIAPQPNGDNTVNTADLLELLVNWGECPNLNDECPEALNPENLSAFLVEDGTYFFETNPDILDGPSRKSTSSGADVFSGAFVTQMGWQVRFDGSIPGGFIASDAFAIDMRFELIEVPNPLFDPECVPSETVECEPETIIVFGPNFPRAIGGDVWFSYQASCNGRAFFSTRSTNQNCSDPEGLDLTPGEIQDTLIEVYPGGACPTAWQEWIDIDDSSEPGCGDHAIAEISVLEGELYLIRIGGWLGEAGTGHLTVTCQDNSLCEAALPLALDSSTTGNTVDADVQNPTVCGIGQDNGGRWYVVTGNGRTLKASTTGTCAFELGQELTTFFDSTISVYCGTAGEVCSDLTCVASSTANECLLHGSTTWCSNDGQDYYILVHGSDQGADGETFFAEGFFQLAVTVDSEFDCIGSLFCGVTRPNNDLCANATVIPDGEAVVDPVTGEEVITLFENINNINASLDGAPTTGCGTTVTDIWYRYTPAFSSSVVVDTCNTGALWDTRIEVHLASDATCPTTGADGLIGCNNDTLGCAGGGSVVGPFILFAGQEILIRVGWPGFGVPEGSGGGNNMRITATLLVSDCPQECPEDAVLEGDSVLGEPLLDDWDGTVATVDTTNGGCNLCSPDQVFDVIADPGSVNDDPAAVGSRICGQISTYVSDADLDCDGALDGVEYNLRDTDWFTLVVPALDDDFGPTDGAIVTFRLSSEFAAEFGITSDVCGATPGEETPFLVSTISGGLCLPVELTANLVAGTYRIVVTSLFTTGTAVDGIHEGHDYVLEVDPFAPAQFPKSNDECVDAITIFSTSSTIVDNRFASDDNADPSGTCPNTQETGTMWYTFVATDVTQSISTCANDLDNGNDSGISVFSGTCGNFVEVGCGGDECAGTFLSDVVFTEDLIIGDTYYIMFSAWPGSQGVYDMELSAP